jgi:hypothetical protein
MSSFAVAMRREGQGVDFDRQALAAHVGQELAARARIAPDIAHRDGEARRRTETARGDRPTSRSFSSKRIVPGRTGWRPSGLMPTRLSRGGSASRRRRASAPMKRPFSQRPWGSPTSDRLRPGRCQGDVLTVQAEAGFQPQAVAGGKPDPGDALVGEQSCGEGFGLFQRQGDLETVLAGIARSGGEPVWRGSVPCMKARRRGRARLRSARPRQPVPEGPGRRDRAGCSVQAAPTRSSSRWRWSVSALPALATTMKRSGQAA